MDDVSDRLKKALADHYRIESELGSGGMATVYLAHDIRHDRQVAVKVLRPELAAATGPERFLREIRIAAKLTHPHILPLHDSGEADGFLFYVMPFIRGESLRERLEREGKLSVSDAVRILREVVDALTEAHENGVIHRDIKPENVMLRGQHARVADFGVAKAVSEAKGRERLTSTGLALGTPVYMAPEQAEGEQEIDARADLYAVGVLGYEMLAGRPPFSGAAFASLLLSKLQGTYAPLDAVRDGLPEPLVGAIHRCLERDRANRWPSARELLNELELLATPPGGVTVSPSGMAISRHSLKRWGLAAVGALALVAVVYAVASQVEKGRVVSRARTGGVAEVQALRDDGNLGLAFARAMELRAILGVDPALDTVLGTFTDSAVIRSEPPGADVWFRPYGHEEEEFLYLGVTPLETTLPLTYADFRFEREGYESRLTPNHLWRFTESFSDYFGGVVRLAPEGSVPEGMVLIPGGDFSLESPGLESVKPVHVGDYFLDRTEVTNRAYKEFLDSGGYQDRAYWVHPFVDGEVTLSWEEAMSRFTDRTGRPGPATWEASDYAEGAEDYPVGGLSWYEAAAYAEFREKALPTIFHWNRALDAFNTYAIAPLSVFNRDAPLPVGASGARGRYGNVDMGGNVREWCFNESSGRRFIMGGGWNDAQFFFNDSYAQSPWDRSESNGLRLALYTEDDPNLAESARPIELPFRDFRALEPASDEVYEAYRSFHAYDQTPLDARVESADTTADWIRERISFDAGYEDQRAILYLFLPRSGGPPYQPIIHYPGSGSLFLDAIEDDDERVWDFLIKTGRAMIYPVFWGTFERRAGLTTDQPDTTAAYRESVRRWSIDFRRSLDWAETRPDLDMDRLGFYGFSWGGRLGPLMVALEPRVKAAVLNVGGLKFQPSKPEVDPFHFAPRVRVPVLMLNGELDHFFPLETSAKPLFELLGTPDSLKHQVVEEGGHFLRQDRVIAETLAWFDRYLGPVR